MDYEQIIPDCVWGLKGSKLLSYFTRLSMKICLFAALLTCASQITVQAKDAYDVIYSWSSGHAYTKDNQMITNGWGYDENSAEGKYVLFDADGNVKQKSSSMTEEADVSQDYTDTEVNPGKVALRTKVYTGFEGTVEVTFHQQENKLTETFLLTKGKMYIGNVSLPQGTYQVDVKAVYEGKTYFSKCKDTRISISPGMVLKLPITVENKEVVMEEKMNSKQDSVSKAAIESEQGKVTEEEKEGFPYFLVILAVGILGLGGYLFFKEGEHHGKRHL